MGSITVVLKRVLSAIALASFTTLALRLVLASASLVDLMYRVDVPFTQEEPIITNNHASLIVRKLISSSIDLTAY